VLDERGHFVISLVSGHLGGANRLALEIAAITGGQSVITTASDVRNRPALDLIAREAALEIDDPAMVARLTRAFPGRGRNLVYDPDQRLAAHLGAAQNVRWVAAASGPDGPPSGDCVGVWVSEKLAPPGRTCLQLRPAT